MSWVGVQLSRHHYTMYKQETGARERPSSSDGSEKHTQRSEASDAFERGEMDEAALDVSPPACRLSDGGLRVEGLQARAAPASRRERRVEARLPHL